MARRRETGDALDLVGFSFLFISGMALTLWGVGLISPRMAVWLSSPVLAVTGAVAVLWLTMGFLRLLGVSLDPEGGE